MYPIDVSIEVLITIPLLTFFIGFLYGIGTGVSYQLNKEKDDKDEISD